MTHLSQAAFAALRRPEESRARFRGSIDVKGLGLMDTYLVPGLDDEGAMAAAAAGQLSGISASEAAEIAAPAGGKGDALSRRSLSGGHTRTSTVALDAAAVAAIEASAHDAAPAAP